MPQDQTGDVDGLPVVAFADRAALRTWLEHEHDSSSGVWVRLAKVRSGIPSVTFHDLLEEGLAFGWSESARRGFDPSSYLQRFTPRRTRGTTSDRNRRIVERLAGDGLMTAAGWIALGMKPP